MRKIKLRWINILNKVSGALVAMAQWGAHWAKEINQIAGKITDTIQN